MLVLQSIELTLVVFIIPKAYISNEFRRKPLVIVSGVWMSLSMKLIYVLICPIKRHSIDCRLFSTSSGLSDTAELYPQRTRGFAAGLTIRAGYFMSFINIKAYPTLVRSVSNEIIFIFYGIVSPLGVVFVCLVQPETKEKSLQKIENHFRNERGRKSEIDIEMLPKS